MRIKSKRVLKNGAVAGYVYYGDEKKWKWRIVGHINSKKGGFKPKFRQVCATESCKTTQKYERIEKNKYSSNNKNYVSAQIKARLATLHNTGFFNTYYKKMLKKYEKANKNENSNSINFIIKNLKNHKNKKYKKNVNKNSKRGARKQYLKNTIKKMEIKSASNKYKKNRPRQIKEEKNKEEIKKSIKTNQFAEHLVTKNREKNNKLVKRELEKRVEFIFKLRQKGLPEPRNESEFHSARVYHNSINDSIYDIEQWIDALQFKREQILEQLYNFITTLDENIDLPNGFGTNELIPVTIGTLNKIKKNNKGIYEKIKKMIKKIENISSLVKFGFVKSSFFNGPIYYLNQTNQNQINKNSNKVSEKLKQHIIDFIKNFDLDLFEKIQDKQIQDFISAKENNNN